MSESVNETPSTESAQTETVQTEANTVITAPPTMVWINDTGAKYHKTSSCSGMQNAC